MMKRLLRLALPLAALLASTSLSAQEIAGRVLVAAGDVVIQRGAEKISARRGTEARTGDIFQVGDKSNVQIRLTDESIIALNSRTTFKLTEYAFQKREPTLRRAFFDLLRGGMRTVTGLIGRTKRENYAVRTATATVGIRGTQYALRYCNNDCYEGGSASASAEPIKVAAADGADIGPLAQAAAGSGALAPNGTYGAVTDGRIGVTNQKGETVFGADQYFHVASINSTPQQLIAPPSFLRDTLEGRAAAKGNKPAAGAQPGQQQQSNGEGGESAGTVAPTGVGGGSGDIGVSGSTTSSTTSTVLAINPFVVTDSVVAGGGIGSIASIPGEGIILYRITGEVLSGVCSSGPPCDFLVAEIRVAFNLQSQTVGLRINGIDLEDGGAFNLATGLQSPGLPLVNNNGVLSFSGTLTAANNSLRCQTCGYEGEPSELQSLALSGTVSGGTLNLTFTGVDVLGESGTFSAVLPSVALGSNPVAAVAYPSVNSASPNQTTQSSGLDNVVDSAGLVRYGWLVGGPQGYRGYATSVIVGSDASAGNLVWGKWTGVGGPTGEEGALITDVDYNTFLTTGQRVDWIYGDPTLVTAVSGLGTVTYTPVGFSLNDGNVNGTLNSASLTANFMTRQIDLNVNATNTYYGNTFQLTGSTQYGVTTTRFQGSLSGTCNGEDCGANVPASGGFSGFIAGSSGQGAGVALSAGYGVAGHGVSGVIGFKR